MGVLAEFIRALAALAWPIVVLVGLLMFRDDLRRVMGRLRKGKLLGQELELEQSITEFRDAVGSAAAEPASPVKLSVGEHSKLRGALTTSPGARSDQAGADDERRIIALSAQDPRSALLQLADSLARELRVLLHATTATSESEYVEPREAASLLVNSGQLSPTVGESLERFWQIRNRVIHGGDVSRRDLFRVIDTGLDLLRTVKRIPAEVVTVLDPGFSVFHDEACTVEFPDIKGITLFYRSPGMSMTRVWGVAKDRMFVAGGHVTKVWDCDRQHGPAWYVEKETGAKLQAWTGICEFVGHPIVGL